MKCEDMSRRLRDSEKTLQSLQRDIATYQVGTISSKLLPVFVISFVFGRMSVRWM